jgi:hypothetical protein
MANYGKKAFEEGEAFMSAIHELGHAQAASAYDCRVRMVRLTREGAGFTYYDVAEKLLQELTISAAGYVAEALYREEEPTFEAMIDDMHHFMDVQFMYTLAVEHKIPVHAAGQLAVMHAIAILMDPYRVRRRMLLAHKLLRTRVLTDAYFCVEPDYEDFGQFKESF